jgi:hypothetical protein
VQKSLGVIRELERRIEAQEERVLKVGRNVMVIELITLRRQVFKVRRYLNYLTYISNVLLLNENKIINDDMIRHGAIIYKATMDNTLLSSVFNILHFTMTYPIAIMKNNSPMYLTNNIPIMYINLSAF